MFSAKRRALLKVGLFGPLLMLLAACAPRARRFFDTSDTSEKPPKFGEPVTMPGTTADYAVGTITTNRYGKFYLVHLPEGFLALYWKCSHLGCTVPFKEDEEYGPNKGVFHCPCHGSIYLGNGQNVAGPTKRPLDRMPVEIRSNKIIVDTGKIIERATAHPSDAVKP